MPTKPKKSAEATAAPRAPYVNPNGGRAMKPGEQLVQRTVRGWPRFSIQVPPELLTRIDTLASEHYRARNAEIVEALRAWVEAEEAAAAKRSKSAR